MQRTLWNLSLALGVVAAASSPAFAQRGGGRGFGGHPSGFGGHPGGFGGHPSMGMPMHSGRFSPSAPRPAGGAARPHPSTGPRGGIAARPSSVHNPIASARPSARPRPSSRRPSELASHRPPTPSRRPTQSGRQPGGVAARPSSLRNPIASARPSARPGPSIRQPSALASHRPRTQGSVGRPSALASSHRPSGSGTSSHPLTAGNKGALALTPSKNNPPSTIASGFAGLGAVMGQIGALASGSLINDLVGLGTLAGNVLSSHPTQPLLGNLIRVNIGGGHAGGGWFGGFSPGSLLGGSRGPNGLSGGPGVCLGNGGGAGCASGGEGTPLVPSDPFASTIAPAPADAIDAADGGSAPSEEDQDGVLLQSVTPGAAAEQAGLRAGDVILSFGGIRTHTFEELRQAVQQGNGPVRVVFVNGENGQTEYLTVKPQDGLIGVTCE